LAGPALAIQIPIPEQGPGKKEQLRALGVYPEISLKNECPDRTSASANVANTKSQLDNAKQTEEQKKQAMDDAQKQLDSDNAKLTADKAVSPPTDAINKEMDDLNKTTIPADQKKAQTAKDEYQNAQSARQAIEDNFNAALTAASAAATGTGQFSEGGTTKNIDKDTADKIATAVTTIVNNGHLTEACINFLATYSFSTPTPAGAQTFELCTTIVQTDLQLKPGEPQKVLAPQAGKR